MHVVPSQPVLPSQPEEQLRQTDKAVQSPQSLIRESQEGGAEGDTDGEKTQT